MNIPADLKPGDILFYKPSDLIGDLIALKTWMPYSHVECMANYGQVIAARAEGTDIYPVRVDEFLTCVRRPPGVFDLANAIRAVKPMMFQGYQAVEGFESFLDPWGAEHKQPTRICSSLATVYLRGGGCQPFNPDFEAADVAPAQLWQSAILQTVWVK